LNHDKAKPSARRGRKAEDLASKAAGLPKGMTRGSPAFLFRKVPAGPSFSRNSSIRGSRKTVIFVKMYKGLLIFLLSVFSFGAAYAAEEAGNGISIDLSFSSAEGNEADYPSTLLGGGGIDLGVNVGLKRLGLGAGTWKSIEFAGRASISYFDWNDGEHSDSYERIPLFIGIRSLMPIFTRHIMLMGQIGPELSMDRQEDYNAWGNLVSEHDSVRVGITPGVGLLFNMYRMYLGVTYNYHIITDAYHNVGVTIGYNF
jgi:hypothetical protein